MKMIEVSVGQQHEVNRRQVFEAEPDRLMRLSRKSQLRSWDQ